MGWPPGGAHGRGGGLPSAGGAHRHGAGGVGPRRAQGCATDAELDDGTGTIVLRWVGRDRVPGVTVGASLAVEGTVLADRGRRVLLNPLYPFS